MAKKIPIAFLALIAIVGIVLTMYVRSASRGLQRYLSDLRAVGEPLTLAEIQSRRSPVTADSRTIADVVARVANKAKTSAGPVSRGVLGMPSGPVIDFFAGIPIDAVDATRRYMAPRRPALAELETIHDLEPGRFAISYDVPPTELMTRFTETSPPIQHLTRLLHLDATLALIDENTEAAAATIAKLFDVVSPLAEEPASMAHLYRVSAAASAVRILENVLRIGTLSGETLKELDDALADYVRSHSMKWALWGERAFHIAMLDAMRSALGIRGAILSVATHADQQRGVQMFGWLIEAADDPANLLAARNRVESELLRIPKTKVFTRMYLASIPMSVTLHLRCLAEILAARIVIAAERFRLFEGQLPTTLDQLVPAYLPEIPADPFDQTLMKLAMRDGGLVIYSVGGDGMDDGGHVVPSEGEKRPRDRGFRLLAESSRGLVLIETSPTDGR